MLEFLIDSIFVDFRGHIFQHMIGIPVGTNCALFSYQTDFSLKYTHTKKAKLLILHSIYWYCSANL
jgi:hypothetical protein